jgi:hypothetical protein
MGHGERPEGQLEKSRDPIMVAFHELGFHGGNREPLKNFV